MVLACIYIRPAIHTAALGDNYAELSINPFSPEPNPVGYRILTPLISFALGLRGQLIIITNLIITTLFLIISYIYFRKHSFEAGDAVFGTAVFALSLVTLTTIYYGGYCDSLTYLIVLLMYWFRKRVPILCILFFFGLLNRESIIVLVPWIGYLVCIESDNKPKKLVIPACGLAVVGLGYWGYREWINSIRAVPFDLNYYFGPLKDDPLAMFKVSISHQGVGLFSVFKASWFFVFTASLYLWSKRNFSQLFSIVFLIFLCWLQMFIARDSSRMLTLAFPAMIIALSHLRESNYLSFKSWGWYLLFFNLLIPQVYTYREVVNIMHSTIVKLGAMIFLGDASW